LCNITEISKQYVGIVGLIWRESLCPGGLGREMAYLQENLGGYTGKKTNLTKRGSGENDKS
jgi:hypothetical protein